MKQSQELKKPVLNHSDMEFQYTILNYSSERIITMGLGCTENTLSELAKTEF